MKLTGAIVRRWPKVSAFIASLAAVLVTFAGCGVDDGTVVEKVHFPDLSGWGIASDGKMVWVSSPECYRVKLQDEKTGKTSNHCVKFSTYNTLNLGDHWTKP